MATRFAESQEFMRRLLDAIGLKGRPVRRIVVDVEVGSAVAVTIDEYLQGEHGDALVDAVSEFEVELKPKPKPETEPGPTSADWRPADEPPTVEPGRTRRVLAVTDDGRVAVAEYANGIYRGREGDAKVYGGGFFADGQAEPYTPNLGVTHWAPLPKPPQS